MDRGKLFENGRPLSQSFFPISAVEFQSLAGGNDGYRLLLGKVRNLITTGLVLNKCTLSCELFDRLFIRRIGRKPQCVPDAIVIIVDDGRRGYPRGGRTLKSLSADELRIIEFVVANADLRLKDASPIPVRSRNGGGVCECVLRW